jgi:hypothetical protein
MIQGTKFELDLDDDEDEKTQAPLPAAFVGDILERKPTAPKPPSLPTLNNINGFPEHKKRPVGESRFKSRKAAIKTSTTPNIAPSSQPSKDNPSSSGNPKSWEEEEKTRIDAENRQKLAEMSPEEIEEERRELMNSLGPALIERLLKRANVADGSEEVDLSRPMGAEDGDAAEEQKNDDVPLDPSKAKSTKTVTFEEPPAPAPAPADDLDLPAGDSASEPQAHDSIHFPQPNQPPSLDPSSTTFLSDLHTKYFPSLPSDPEKLEWMQPDPSPSPYSPAATALSPDQIRFSFRGELIPPSVAATIPVTAGLHHHGDAPDSAGYTIPELAHLARSTYPAQRCIAFQTLGRILYRLGQGEFGQPDGEAATRVGEDDAEGRGELARGLWREMERLKVVEILVDESEGRGVDKGRHLSAKTYAIEAVWLWRKGGGRRWKAG